MANSALLPHAEPVRATAILNLGSGKQQQQQLADKLARLFDERGGELRIGFARRPQDIYAFARDAVSEQRPIVLAGGGDGTISAVASVLANSNTSLGVLPLGTFNYFARRLSIPLDIEEAARLCFDGEVRSISLAEVNGRVFLNNASVGLYPSMLKIREKAYRRFGRSQFLAYLSAIRALLLARSHVQVSIEAGGKQQAMRTPLVFAVNNAYQLEEFEAQGSECVRGGRIAVYVLPPVGRAGLLRIGWKMLRRKLQPQEDFRLVCSKNVIVETRRPQVRVAYDGELTQMRAPLEFRVREDALRVLVPAFGDPH
jgi:diacylglycerol kinase family enzyme